MLSAAKSRENEPWSDWTKGDSRSGFGLLSSCLSSRASCYLDLSFHAGPPPLAGAGTGCTPASSVLLKPKASKMKKSLLLFLTALVVLTTGCRSLFTSGSNSVKSPWKDFAEARTAFDQIVPGQTTTNE